MNNDNHNVPATVARPSPRIDNYVAETATAVTKIHKAILHCPTIDSKIPNSAISSCQCLLDTAKKVFFAHVRLVKFVTSSAISFTDIDSNRHFAGVPQ